MRIERATLLLEQSRYEMAEKELRLALVESPDDASAHALLGLCLSYQKQYQEAKQSAETSVSLAPDTPFPHYILAYILCDGTELELAEKSIMEAIRLNPYQGAYFALLARCKYNQKLWNEALSSANQGLAIDAENVECLNYRALCLSQLGRGEEALAAVEGAIAASPEDAASYASSGWILLSHGKSPDKALEYFREALRINPTLEWARQGVVAALKAQNPVYRMILRYFLWSSRLTQRNRWIFAVGLYFAIRLLLTGLNQAGFSQLVAVVAAVYLIFVILTWVADPLFTLLLRFNKFGRLALSDSEIQQSNWWAACFGIAIASLILWVSTNNNTALISAIAFCLLLIPTAAIFHCQPGRARNIMRIYTGVLALLALASIVLSMLSKSLWLIPMLAFIVSAIASSWVATWLTGIKPKK